MEGSSTIPRSSSARSPPRQMPSSSVDSCSDPHPCLNNLTANGDHEEVKSSYLDTDLSLGHGGNIHIPRIEPLPRNTIAGRFFVKVYMEGILIGRKLDVLAHNNYDDLIVSLTRMFNTNIHRPGECATLNLPNKFNVLTYEDKDGDWMMVGDVPWEMFKCTVKRMMITRAVKC